MRLGIFLLSLGLTFSANAQNVIDTWKRYASCQVNGVDYDISVRPGVDVSKASATQPVDAMILESSPTEQKILSVSARIEDSTASSFKATMPGYWSLTELTAADCTLVESKSVLFKKRSLIKLKVSGYFIYASIPWEDATLKLPDLIKTCDAIPIDFTVICDKHPGATGPLGCDQAEIVDDIIPVTTSCD